MSTIKKPPVDVVIVGFGWTGAIMGMELTDSGLQVLALERGERRDTYPDFAYPRIADELTYGIRLKLAQEMAHETVTVRHTPADFAVPYRQLGSFLPGNGVGGAGVHWNGMHWRALPSDLKLHTTLTEKYGANWIPEGMTLQDYPLSYQELEVSSSRAAIRSKGRVAMTTRRRRLNSSTRAHCLAKPPNR